MTLLNLMNANTTATFLQFFCHSLKSWFNDPNIVIEKKRGVYKTVHAVPKSVRVYSKIPFIILFFSTKKRKFQICHHFFVKDFLLKKLFVFFRKLIVKK